MPFVTTSDKAAIFDMTMVFAYCYGFNGFKGETNSVT